MSKASCMPEAEQFWTSGCQALSGASLLVYGLGFQTPKPGMCDVEHVAGKLSAQPSMTWKIPRYCKLRPLKASHWVNGFPVRV